MGLIDEELEAAKEKVNSVTLQTAHTNLLSMITKLHQHVVKPAGQHRVVELPGPDTTNFSVLPTGRHNILRPTPWRQMQYDSVMVDKKSQVKTLT